VYRRLVPRLGHNKTIGVIAHRLCHLIWIILHKGVRYEERGPAVSEKSRQRRTARMVRTLRILGYRVEPLTNPTWGTRFSTQSLSRENRPLSTRATEERALPYLPEPAARRCCLSAVGSCLGRTGHPFAVSGRWGPSQKI